MTAATSKKAAPADAPAVKKKGLYLRVSQELRERIEIGRLAKHKDHPLEAPSMQDYLVTTLEAVLPPLPKRKKDAS